ncbi:MAG: UDP-N-acetylglucosamine 4,6-dehydratase (inverting) [Pelotomaculum sp. PtaU1.Bin035]|nr:MAG: UDP-N-acetylglucosamine 4,6-dehydratase (inverting) [Pelotomaculum sp. PtaU1.Bin035]
MSVDRFFYGKKILIIGGTGTIGQGLLKAILPSQPEVIRIFSRDEDKQFELRQQMTEHRNIRYLIGDVRDPDRVRRSMQDIDYVFHLAAMKHVPACEYDPYEAVKTNIIGTQNVIQASLNAGVKKTIFTSTDKAIAPTNTYGATKLMAERLIASAQYNSGTHKTVFAAVRFGNVMGSRGSVIPLFKSQIKRQRRITVTDLTMSRFMMTLKQATDLTIKAMKIARGGEVFILKMPVVQLKDLVDTMIEEMAGRLNIDPDTIVMEEIGLRPGEKMYEELMTCDESKLAYELPDMFVIPNIFLGKTFDYPEAKRAEQRSYSSNDAPPVLRQEVLQMLRQNGLV